MIKIYIFFSIYDVNDFYHMVDSSVFNNIIKIIKTFLKIAVNNANINKLSTSYPQVIHKQLREKVVN